MIASVLLAAATGAASPVPSPSALPYPVIVHTITSRSCTVLRDTIMPIGIVLKKDDDAFGGMSDRVQKIFNDFGNEGNQGGAPTSQQLMQLGGSKYEYGSGKASQGAVNPGSGEDQQLFSPAQVAKASEVESIVNAVHTNLAFASQLLDKSTSTMAQGGDPKADEMRAGAQTLIQLQHSFDDNYDKFISTYVNNQNTYWVTDQDQRAFVNAYLVALVTGQGPAGSGAAGSNGRSLPDAERAQIASIAGVVQDLRQDEQAFGADLVATYNQCNGTHITLDGSPSPNP